MKKHIAVFETTRKSFRKSNGKPTKAVIKAAAARSRLVCVPIDPVLVCALLAAIRSSKPLERQPDPEVIASRKHMQDAGWSQRPAAAILGVPVSTLNAVLNGRHLNPELVARIRLLPVRKP